MKRERNEEIEHESNKRLRTEGELSLTSDNLCCIFQFLDWPHLSTVSLVCWAWYASASHNAVWVPIHKQDLHLGKLVSNIKRDAEESRFWSLYNDFSWCTWKHELLRKYTNSVCDEDDIPPTDEEDVDLEELVANLGAPLVSGTLEEQYYLIHDKINMSEFREMVKDVLDTQVDVVESGYWMKDLCRYEHEQMKYYVEYMEQQIKDGNNEFHGMTSDDTYYVDMRRAISRTVGQFYIDPEVYEESLNTQKGFLKAVINVAGDLAYKRNQVTPECNDDDIAEAIKIVTNRKLYGCGFKAGFFLPPEPIEYYRASTVEEDLDVLKENDELVFDQESDSDDDFIDDSACEFGEDFSPDQLGDTLQDQLIKVSIRVHEMVYGPDRTHKEKLYLQNWFGFGSAMFQHFNHPDNEYEDEHFDYETHTELQRIESDRRQDELYFGDSTFDMEDTDSDNEEEDQVDGTEYHLRKLLRQESLNCIQEYFQQKTLSDNSAESTDSA